MTTANAIKYGVIALLAILLAVTYRNYGKEQAINAQSVAALKASQQNQLATSDTVALVRKQLAAKYAKVDTLWKSATVYVERSSNFAKAADSLMHLAPPDTAHSCTLITQALQARTSECEQLRGALALDSEAIQTGQRQLLLTAAQLAGVQDSLASLHRSLGVVQKPYTCHLLPFIPCLSRTMSFFMGAVVLEGVRAALTRKP